MNKNQEIGQYSILSILEEKKTKRIQGEEKKIEQNCKTKNS